MPPNDPDLALCFSRRVLQLSCPGCGLTRALAHFAKGEWRATIEMHPLAPFLAIEAVTLWVVWGLVLSGYWRPLRANWINRWLVVHIVALCGVWLARLIFSATPV